MTDGASYLRSETTLRQPSQRNIRSAGCVPELRWSVKCFTLRAAAIADACGHFLCIGCAFEHRGSIAEKNQADEWQKNRFATVQFEAFSRKNRHLREFPWPARSVTRPGEPLVRGSKITALRSWRCPRFCHGAVDDVALELACIVGKKTFASPGPACSARSRPASWENHKRCIADPGFGRRAWVTSPESALTGRPGFAGEPTSRCGFEGVRCNDADLNVVALRAFE